MNGNPHLHMIGIAQMKMSSDPRDVLSAPNLGSCLGIAVFDPVQHFGGMIHCLLPLSKNDPQKAAANPCMYVDTGVSLLLEQMFSHGVDRKRMTVVAVGGANINDENNVFEVGKKNITILKKLLWKNNLLLAAEDFGEHVSRTISLHIETGKITLKVNGTIRELA